MINFIGQITGKKKRSKLTWDLDTSIVISVSTLGPSSKVLKNQGDFHAEGESILLLKGVPPNLGIENLPQS